MLIKNEILDLACEAAINPIAMPLVAGIANVPKICELENWEESDCSHTIVSFPTLFQSICPWRY